MKSKYAVYGEIKMIGNVSSQCIMKACFIAEDDGDEDDEEVVVCKGQGKAWD